MIRIFVQPHAIVARPLHGDGHVLRQRLTGCEAMSETAIAMSPQRHRFYEDLLAIALGALMVSVGIVFFAKATVLTGGAAGLALLLQFAAGWNFSLLFFVINLPFYWLALRRMGLPFTMRTIAAVGLISLFVWATPHWLRIESVAPLYAAIAGGVAMGLGLLALARHRTAIGGVNILALYLQERHGWRAGWVQLGIDAMIFTAALFLIPLDKVALSLVGTVVINAILAMNHKPGRYMAVS